MTLWLHPGARKDPWEAAEFYREERDASLSHAFLDEFERAVNLLLAHPSLGQPWRAQKRRFVLRSFPYSVIYTTSGSELRVYAVAHHSRHPGYWRGRS